MRGGWLTFALMLSASQAQGACAQVLEDKAHWRVSANAIEIRNDSPDDAIVKIRGESGALLVALLVRRHAVLRYELVPDGVYRVQFAYGSGLDKSCARFTRFHRAAEFPDAETLNANVFGFPGSLVYVLRSPGRGNVDPRPIDAATFAQP